MCLQTWVILSFYRYIDIFLYIIQNFLFAASREGQLVVWGEGLGEGAAAGSHAGLVEGVIDLLALPAHIHQSRGAQDAEMVGDGGLGDVDSSDDLPHVQPAAAAQAHDFLAGIIRQGFCEGNRIRRFRHIDILLCVHILIDDHQYVKGIIHDSLMLNLTLCWFQVMINYGLLAERAAVLDIPTMPVQPI
jgi:hypothetical protein